MGAPMKQTFPSLLEDSSCLKSATYWMKLAAIDINNQ